MGLSVRLLGPLEVAGPAGPVRLSGARQRAVLALLALRSPGVVSQADLVDGLWGTDPPPTAVKTLHSHIARIRHALAAIGVGDLLVTREPGYALLLAPDRVDVTVFERYLAEGRKAAQGGDAVTAAVELRAGLALWRGDPLADCPVAEWGAAEVARLNEAMVGGAEALAEADVMRGEHTAVASELERLVARHPLRERLWELLVVAHHRSGHPAEALQAYRRARAVLIDELGVEPGPRLRRLEGELLAGVAELDPAIVPVARRADPVAPRVSLAGLVGRRFELAEVLDLVRDKRLVTLTGPGGCGKTRLAVAVTERLTGEFRTELLDLTAVRSPEQVVEAVATALNIPEQPGKDRHDALVAGLARQELLVVLDNCEQVVASVSLLVESLLTRCPGLRVLATSREALRIPGEAAYAVPPLAVPDPEVPRTLAELATYDAVRLFLDRAAEHAGPDFTDDDSRPIATLCAALDGLPLAIELAAARTPVLTPAQIVVRLRDRFGLLSYGTRTSSPPHHRALRAALAWSHDLLSADEAALFARLAVFAGGFGVEAAEAVWHPDRTLDALTGLVAKSLVRSGRTGGSTRFWMLETISAYAKEKLTADPALEAATRRQHAAFFLERIEQAARDASGAGFGELRVEHENLRAAMSWYGQAESGTDHLRMAAALSRYCRLYGHYHDGRRWLAEALRRSAETPAELQARALTGAASLALSECDYDQADRYAAEALELVTGKENQGQVGRLLLLRGAVARERATYAEALEHYGASEHAFRAFGDRAGAAYSRQLAGATSWQAGDLDAAAGALTASLAELRELQDRRGEASSRAYLGAVALYRGDRHTARQLLDQSLDTFGELDFKEGIAWALNLLGLVEHRDDNHAEATRLLEASLALHRDLGDLWRQASVLEALAGVSCATLDVARAVHLLRQATEIRTLIGTPVPAIERPDLTRIQATLTPHTQLV